MLRFYQRITQVEQTNPSEKEDGNSSSLKRSRVEINLEDDNPQPLKQSRVETNWADLEADPGRRRRIINCDANDQDQIRRAYLQKGPFQTSDHNFPRTRFGAKLRRFNKVWFTQFPTWLEYSIAENAAFCLCCYLFKLEMGDQSGGDSFVGEGFRNWKKCEKLHMHVGGSNSAHNQAWGKCVDLLNQRQHIQTVFDNQSNQTRIDYRIRLNASVNYIRFLLRQGLAFRGHDESADSSNQGNFLELLKFLADHNEDVKAVALDKAPQNLKLIAPDIQKDIESAAAFSTIKAIVKDLDNALFSVLVDEARDISIKEQMAVAIQYVDKKGNVIERFLSVEHVANTNATSLMEAMEALFCHLGLSMSRLRGQGYDGASNMQGEFNGLKTLILKENPCAYYVHCFAHQLQLALVAVAKNHEDIAMLFYLVSRVVTIAGVSCKCCDILKDTQAANVIEALSIGELSSGQGLNQEINLKRAGDTRWGSHYGSLISLINMFPSVTNVLNIVFADGVNSGQRSEAKVLLVWMQYFEFILSIHLMKFILAITSELSQALQRKDQDIVNVINLVNLSKRQLQLMRDRGWESLLDDVSSFCAKYEIEIPEMEDAFVAQGKGKRKAHGITNLHHYRAELFYTVIDMQLQELNACFMEASTELLLSVACLNPSNSFYSFDKKRLIRLAEFYPQEFSSMEVLVLSDQLDTYLFYMQSNHDLSRLNGLTDLAQKMVETRRDKLYPLVYMLLTLALILPVATATVERAFSAMNIVKNRLRNRMNDQWLNNSLVVYIERDVFDGIDNNTIMQKFQKMKTRRGQL